MLSLVGIILPLTPLRPSIDIKRSHAHPPVTVAHYMIIFQRQKLLIKGTEETTITFWLSHFAPISSLILSPQKGNEAA